MSVTIDANKVQELLRTDKDVSSFVDTAALVVTEDLGNVGLSEARKTQIGIYLAAHYGQIALKGGQVVSSSVDGATDRWGGKYGVGFQATAFGQQAMELDTSRTLISLSKSKYKPVLRVV